MIYYTRGFYKRGGDGLYQIFFVDDEPLVLDSLMSSPAFLECGYQNAGYSHNSVTAVDAVRQTRPDVVFSDLKMPGLNGAELMAELKRTGYDGEFVMVSAYAEFEEARRFFKMDGFDYLLKPVSDQDLYGLLEKLTARLAAKKAVPAAVTETPSPELNRITSYLRRHLSSRHTLESVSEAFGYTPNYICRLFSRYLGTTFVSYSTKIRMDEAAALLKTTDKPVKEIAALCGYGDYFYFCRVFREKHACTPSSYREAAQ